MQVYKDYSKVVLRLDKETITLKLWKCFSNKDIDITTYSLSDDYSDYIDAQGKLANDPDYLKFISYLKIDTNDEWWWSRCGQVISEEKILNEQCDYEYRYKFHYLMQTAEGDILIIIPFTPIDLYFKE